MSVVEKAIWVMERNAGERLSLPAVAEACGVSRSHLANAFGSATGWSVVKYLRARRLSEAAEALAAGAPDILAVAMDAGYGSHEAFTRAFREQFGLVPEQIRERGSVATLPLLQPLQLRAQDRPALGPPTLAEAGPIRAVGLQRHHGFDSVVGIPIQWRAFMELQGRIAHRFDAIPIGVLSAERTDGLFAYAAAVEVARFGALPQGLVRIELPRRPCAVFEHRGHVSTIFDTYAAIWNVALPQYDLRPGDLPVVERHSPSFDPDTGEGGLSIWVPLAR